MKKLRKSNKDYWLCGVCGGVAEYFGIDANIIRLIWVISGIGWVAYLVCAILLPEGADETQAFDDEHIDDRQN